MTEQETKQFGEALAERFWQKEMDLHFAEKRHWDDLSNAASTTKEVQGTFLLLKAASDNHKLFLEIIGTLPHEIRIIFFNHYNQINGNQGGDLL
ncbi:hypothetical protein [Paenibacillus wynnii]|uniref:Uncharacterized protein n=1 Tax=Paenibacillus wynnii TaxID=268407 RepID=A0A098M4X4_9BACL|nr:hypothetical protein [Paenibacillus wynnii]KGE17600.1 hypothetical protein PWYN_23735 [Paenibacillus wynnii]